MDPFRKWLPPALRDGVFLDDSIGGLVVLHFVIGPEVDNGGIVQFRIDVGVSVAEREKRIMYAIVAVPSVAREALEERMSYLRCISFFIGYGGSRCWFRSK